jgi:uncharacterized membrane protein YhaH (DUF805 family)
MDKLVDLFTFEGRANRAWYFWQTLLDGFAITVLAVVLVMVGVAVGSPFGFLVVPPLLSVVVGGSWTGIAITVKRLHDLGRPGWHWWLLFIPLYNIYLGLVLLLQRGTPGQNLYGPDPLGAIRSGYLPR